MSFGRVLVVDDEPQIRRVLRSTLAARGYEVQDARTGEEALESFRKSRFDLVLLDVNMPGMSGLEGCRSRRLRYEAVRYAGTTRTHSSRFAPAAGVSGAQPVGDSRGIADQSHAS